MANDLTLQSTNGHPVDQHLRPVKIGGEVTGLEISKNAVRISGDFEVNGDIGTLNLSCINIGPISSNEKFCFSENGTPFAELWQNNGGNLSLGSADGTGDSFTIQVIQNALTAIATTNAAGASGHLLIEADGYVDIGSTGSNNITLDSAQDIVLDADGGNITLQDGGSTYTPTAASDATTKTYVDTQTVITGAAYNARINNTTWILMNQASSHLLGGTDTVVGNTESTGILGSFDMRCLLYIVPYNMTVHAISGSVYDDDMTTDVDKRIGLWRLPSLGVSGADPGNTSPATFTLAYITDAFGCTPGKVGAFYDTSANFELTAGDGIFMGYLNPQSGGNDDVALNMSIWAHQTTP